MNLLELQKQAAELALDPEYQAFSSSLYQQWVNDGILYVAKRLPSPLVPLLVVKQIIDWVEGQEEYSLAPDFLKLVRVKADGQDCDIVGTSKWKALERNVFCTPSREIPFATRIGSSLLIQPTLSGTGIMKGGLCITYVKRPPKLVFPTDVPLIDDQYHYLIARYGAYISKLLNEDAGAGELLREINDSIKAVITLYTE